MFSTRQMIKASCIVPTRNRKLMLSKAIDSIVKQGSDIEVVVVDDGSTDGTADLVKKCYPKIKLISLSGKGCAVARNAGAVAAASDIFMFLDDDDIWQPGHVEKLLAVLSRGFDVAYGPAHNINQLSESEFYVPEKKFLLEGDLFGHLSGWCHLLPSSCAVRRNAFEAVEGFPEIPFGEDWLFFLRLASRYPFGCTDSEPITLRYLHHGSICELESADKIFGLMDKILDFLKHENRLTEVEMLNYNKRVEWIKDHADNWQSVQEWYLAMIKEKFI